MFSVMTRQTRMLTWVVWLFLGALALYSFVTPFATGGALTYLTVLAALTAGLHAYIRYGAKGAAILFLSTWMISNFAEALSIQTGFPFGHYFYLAMPGPRIGEVPMLVMLSYFYLAYSSWTIAQVLTHHLSQESLRGIQIILLPLIATFVFVMWDLVVDPSAATVGHLWVWQAGGTYFNVPISNFFGWCLVGYLIFQTFAFFSARFGNQTSTSTRSRSFWLQMVTLYGIEAMTVLLRGLYARGNVATNHSMALIACFTMGFVVVLSLYSLYYNSSERYEELT